MCLGFTVLLITRVASWLRLSQREETWKTAESLILRHQLAVLQRRQPRRPNLNWADRALIAALPGVTPKASRHGMWLLVAPDTILRWRRDLVRRQVVIDDQPRHQRQLLLSQPGPSRAAPQLVLAVQAIAGERGGDPTRYTRA